MDDDEIPPFDCIAPDRQFVSTYTAYESIRAKEEMFEYMMGYIRFITWCKG